VCYDFPEPIEHIDSFESGNNLDDKLDKYITEILKEKVFIDTI
jgi:hypothetical protein